ncbi:MAG TPA: carboxypeptidase regulatory-like domain-containing protein [Solirubrobacteraceae bacterium]
MRGGRWRKGTGHWAFAAVVGAVVSLALAPAALAATSSIEGTVKEAAVAHKTLEHVTVTVYGLNEGEVKGSTSTGPNGEYKVTGLAEGSYKVEFSDEPTFVTQYYDKQLSFRGATSFFLGEGATRTIEAELQKVGKIEGKVTNVSGTGLSGVTIDIDRMNGEFVRSTTTGGNGEYTVEGLSPSEYTVSFYPGNNTGYLYQSVATTVKEAPEVDALNVTLREGGKISGMVTSAATRGGLAKIGVYAVNANSGEEFISNSTVTNAKGEYTVTGLPAGPYKVEFYWEQSEAEEKACAHAVQCPAPYITQWYSNQPSAVTANPVTATAGATTSGVNAAMVSSAPFNTAAPAISGTPTVGSVLSCSNGSWSGDPELTLSAGWPLSSTFTYQWLREGAAIAGATSSAYLVQAADVGHGLVCEVTATNVAGHVSARSAAVTVLLPVVTVSSSKIAASGGSARVPLACTNATCAGTIELTGLVKGKGRKAKKKTVILAKGSYSLAAGKKATISVRLTAAGKSALAATKGRLSGKATVTVTGGTTVKKSIVVSEPVKRKRR